jgi:hypothetical protein
MAVDQRHIALLDSDDVWLPDHLASLMTVYGGAGTLATAPMLRWIPYSGLAAEEKNLRVESHGQLSRLLFENYVRGACLFSRSDYERVGGFRTDLIEDWDLWIRMVRSGVKVVMTHYPTALYRFSRTSLSQAATVHALGLETLKRAVNEAQNDAESVVARKALRRQAGRLGLVRAYEAARVHENYVARRAALTALSGPLPVKMRAMVVLLAPKIGTQQRDRRRWVPQAWLRG